MKIQRMRTQNTAALIKNLQNQIRSREQHLKQVNEQWSIKAIETVRDYFKGKNEANFDRKTDQLSKRQAFEKAIKPVDVALGKLTKETKSMQALYTAIQSVYENEDIGQATQKQHIAFNGGCSSCYARLKAIATKMTEDKVEVQMSWIKDRTDEIAALESQIKDLQNTISLDSESKPKRGRPKKQTTKMVKESGDNESKD